MTTEVMTIVDDEKVKELEGFCQDVQSHVRQSSQDFTVSLVGFDAVRPIVGTVGIRSSSGGAVSARDDSLRVVVRVVHERKGRWLKNSERVELKV